MAQGLRPTGHLLPAQCQFPPLPGSAWRAGCQSLVAPALCSVALSGPLLCVWHLAGVQNPLAALAVQALSMIPMRCVSDSFLFSARYWGACLAWSCEHRGSRFLLRVGLNHIPFSPVDSAVCRAEGTCSWVEIKELVQVTQSRASSGLLEGLGSVVMLVFALAGCLSSLRRMLSKWRSKFAFRTLVRDWGK